MRGFASESHKSSVPADFDELKEIKQISKVERLLGDIPPNALSKRAMQCGSYARALFHWEQFIRKIEYQNNREMDQDELDVHYKHLQDIYAQIEEPDGIEGISAQLHILDPEQQILEHKRAGRWTAVQSWYELALAENPGDVNAQNELLLCLKASGQHGKCYFKTWLMQSLTAVRVPPELGRALGCFYAFFFYACPPIRSRSGMDHRQMGRARKIAQFQNQQHLIRLQRRHR